MYPMSAPAQNDRPSPASTTTRTPSSSEISSKHLVSSSIRPTFNALCASGRVRVTVTTGPLLVSFKTSDIGTPISQGQRNCYLLLHGSSWSPVTLHEASLSEISLGRTSTSVRALKGNQTG